MSRNSYKKFKITLANHLNRNEGNVLRSAKLTAYWKTPCSVPAKLNHVSHLLTYGAVVFPRIITHRRRPSGLQATPVVPSPISRTNSLAALPPSPSASVPPPRAATSRSNASCWTALHWQRHLRQLHAALLELALPECADGARCHGLPLPRPI